MKKKIETDTPEDFIQELDDLTDKLPSRIDTNAKNAGVGLAKLVLTLIDLIRKLMEKQAMRRIEGGSLSDDEIERLGMTFIKLEDRMNKLKKDFGFKDEDLNINLGPLGDLM